MNKKKLSVVMAGAMLASSVAPVLAAEVTNTELDQNELGSLVVKVYDKLTSKLYSDTSSATAKAELEAGVVDINDDKVGHSVYTVTVDGSPINCTAADGGLAISTLDLRKDENKAKLKRALQEEFKNLTAGQKVKISSLGFIESKGYVLSQEKVDVKYTTEDFKNATANQNDLTKKIYNSLTAGTNYDSPDGTKAVLIPKEAEGKKHVFTDVANGQATKISIYLKEAIKVEGSKAVEVKTENQSANNNVAVGKYNVLEIKPNGKKLDFTNVILSNNTVKKVAELTGTEEIVGFPVVTTYSAVSPEDVETIEITGKENNLKTEDLYDGLMLTTEGHDLLSLVKSSRKKTKYTVDFKSISGNEIAEKSNVTLDLFKGEYGFTITIKDAFGKTTVYTVKGDKKATETLASWLNTELAKVDILAGANRYATAVQIAKEQASIGAFEDDAVANIVLVNGKALVDGLAAAPLAAVKDAPVLLTAADSLPKETKAYIKELLYNKSQNDLDHDYGVTVHLVGGRSVLSTAVENELEDMGLKIKRYNGDNREETSLKVAEEIGSKAKDEAFVVGAEGEADAMSIAGVASTEDTLDSDKVRPIIVSKKGGLTDDELDYLSNKAVTVLGGEKSVSAEDYEALEENVGTTGTVRRIAGENRQATNAAIIKTFYHADGIVNGKVQSVVVAKDGRGNKDELVDALTAANLAVKKNAPILLAKNSLSAEQMDAINLRAKSSKSLYQVGEGVERSVMETLAKALGLSNLK